MHKWQETQAEVLKPSPQAVVVLGEPLQVAQVVVEPLVIATSVDKAVGGVAGTLQAQVEQVVLVESLVVAALVAPAALQLAELAAQGPMGNVEYGVGRGKALRKAVIRTATNLVENVIELADGASWLPPPDCYLRDAWNASPGDTWDGTKYVARQPTPEEVAQALEEKTIRGTLLDTGRTALANWDTLTTAQKDRLFQGVIRYILWKES